MYLGPNQACFWLGRRECRRERAVPSEAADQQQNLSIATAATLVCIPIVSPALHLPEYMGNLYCHILVPPSP